MSDILNKNIVLVLNRNWQAIHVRTPMDAFSQLANGAATALDMKGDEYMRPVRWDEWIRLPVREQDYSVQTVRGPIRVPTVMVAVNYSKVPRYRPRLSSRSIRQRDRNRCQYTGRLLQPDQGSLDHVRPRSRGGKASWENLVWACKRVNQQKGDRLPEEAGLRLLSVPRAPKEIPVTFMIRNTHEIPDWTFFIQS